MVFADDRYQSSVVELAKRGNLQALSYWVNSALAPYKLYARLSFIRAGYLRVQIEFAANTKRDVQSPSLRNQLIRFICHQLWKLNSETLDAAHVVACYAGQSKILWKQSVRVLSPARRAMLDRSPTQIRTKIRQASNRRTQFQMMRSIMISGSSAAAFILGCWLGYADSPSEQTNASAIMTNVSFQGAQVQGNAASVSVLKPKSNNNDGSLHLMFGGDVSLDESYGAAVGNNYQWPFGNLEEGRWADISMVNLNAPLTTALQAQPGKQKIAKGSPTHVEALKNGGIDLVNLANNHTMDYQSAGLDETLKTLEKAGIAAVGAGRNQQEARRPVVMELKGQRIAYLGYYDSDFNAAGDNAAGINPRRNDRIAADIKSLRSQVDWIVVNYHWGEELAKYPGDWQIDLARFTVDQGADLVVGHHAKTLQGAEVYKGRPIVYSLGNFIFGGKSTDKTASDYDTAVLKVGLKDKQMKVEFQPVEVRNFQAKAVKGDRAQQILNSITNVSDIFQEPLGTSVILDARSNRVVPPNEPEATTPEPEANPEPETSPAPILEETPAAGPDQSDPWNQKSFTGSDPAKSTQPQENRAIETNSATDQAPEAKTIETNSDTDQAPEAKTIETNSDTDQAPEAKTMEGSPEPSPKAVETNITPPAAPPADPKQPLLMRPMLPSFAPPAPVHGAIMPTPSPLPSLEPHKRFFAAIDQGIAPDLSQPAPAVTASAQ
jgi:poly-gamma-glutamate capsule biosynthesis protein CapA/YwtB (metallophosphatase superfamily)